MDYLILVLNILFTLNAFAAGSIQNEDVKSLAELTGAGGNITQLINETKLYSTVLSEQLSTGLTNGDVCNSTVPMNLSQQVTPANPGAGFDKCYVKNDDAFYCLTHLGVEQKIGPGSGGTVTSVSASVPAYESVSVTNPTTTPNIAITANSQAANTFLAGPVGGGPSVPTYRTLVAGDGTGLFVNIAGDTMTGQLNLPSLGFTPNGQTFSPYQSGLAANDAIKLQNSSIGATLGIQNNNAAGFSGIEYYDNTGSLQVFSGYHNGTGQFRFNNINGSAVIDFMANSVVKFEVDGNRNESTVPLQADAAVDFQQIATPANPGAGFDRCYTKNDDKFYCKTSGGVEELIGPNAGGGGTVTSVSASVPAYESVTVTNPTTTPNIAITANNQSAHTVLAGPVAGGPTTPTYRVLDKTDIPNIDGSQINGTATGDLLVYKVGGTGFNILSVGSNSQQLFADSTATLGIKWENAYPSQAIGAANIDWSTGSVFTQTLSANTTFTFSNVSSGQTIVVRITNTAGNFTVTWPVAVLWPGGTQPTQTIGAHTDVWTFVNDGTNTYGTVVQNY